jgi:hypothetical protein
MTETKKLSAAEKRAVIKKGIRDFFKWDYHYERGMLLGLIVGLIYFTIKAQPDPTLAVVYAQGVTPYGVLWTWINALYWTNLPYSLVLLAEASATLLFQWWLVKKHRLDKVFVELNLFTIVFLMVMHSQQNITTIMLAPLLCVSPLVLIPMILQRFPIGWSWSLNDPHWNCAFHGTGNGITPWINPCLSQAVRLDPLHAYSMTYVVTAIWFIVPLLYWYRNHWRGKFYSLADYLLKFGITDSEEIFQDAFIGTSMREWFCSLCGEWKGVEWFERGNIEKDGYVEFGFSIKNGFWFHGQWLCWTCTKSEESVARGENGVSTGGS